MTDQFVSQVTVHQPEHKEKHLLLQNNVKLLSKCNLNVNTVCFKYDVMIREDKKTLQWAPEGEITPQQHSKTDIKQH